MKVRDGMSSLPTCATSIDKSSASDVLKAVLPVRKVYVCTAWLIHVGSMSSSDV